jgi:excinuclease ABC subunit C
MMREVLQRAWAHVISEGEEKPDLVVIDGGRGQVSSAIQGMLAAGCDEADLPAVVGIAKRLDELYLPDRTAPVQIPHSSPALRLLQRLRDEAHRFAVEYHRKLRNQRSTRSRLEEVEGIGPVLSRRLIREFGSLKQIKQLDASELEKVKGMSRNKADALVRVLASEAKR